MLKNLLTTLTLLLLATSISFSQSIGIIGSATPDGWDADTDMVQDMDNTDLWTLSITLTTGEAKFRQDDDWAVNWGDTAFPTGTGSQDGSNIPVAGGPYDITFNSATGEYTFTSTFTPFESIGIIGPATENGWDSDTDLAAIDSIPWVYYSEMTLATGDAKFRANDAWDVADWGAADFPSGVGTLGGANIPVEGGDYGVLFNSATGEYSFNLLIPVYTTIGIIGDATPGGWAEDTDLVQNPTNVSLWSANITFTDGEAKFRAEDDWPVNWGAEDFPSGTAVQDGPNIPVEAGEYNVNFNSATGEYSFDPPISIFNTIGIIGDALPSGWDSDVDMYQDPVNPDDWTIQITLATGQLKFRADDDWPVNWGAPDFPVGTGTMGGDNIQVIEGTWQINFNATTGVYSFTPVSVGIIGTALEDDWNSDEDLDCSNAEGNIWTTQKFLTAEECKFRQDDDWPINWGADAFPTGTGTQDGPNIPIAAEGNYDIMINTGTGDYSFMLVNSTTEVLNPNVVKVFPNPTDATLNINIDAPELQGDVTITVLDMTGKVLRSGDYNATSNISIDVSNFSNGMYLLHVSGEQYIIGKRFTVAK